MGVLSKKNQFVASSYDDIDVEIVEAVPVLFTYPNKDGVDTVPEGAPAARIVFQSLANPDVKITEHYGVGGATINDAGDDFNPPDGREGLADSCKLIYFVNELGKAGKDVNDLKDLVGVRGHLLTLDVAEKKFNFKRIRAITKLVEGGGSSAAGPSGDTEAFAKKFVKAVVEKLGSASKTDLSKAANKNLKGKRQDLPQLVALVMNDRFLKGLAEEGVIAFDGTKVSKPGEDAGDGLDLS